MNSRPFVRFTVVSLRIFLGLIFFSSGMAKLFDGQFPGIIGPVWLEDALSEYGLGLYARFIAYSQVIIGLLLLTQRFATLGAIMLFPMLMNIFMVTVSMEWRGTPYILFTFLVFNVILLIADFHQLKGIVAQDPRPLKRITVRRKPLKIDLLWVLGMVITVGSTFLYHQHALTAYTMVIVGLIIFIACQVWQRVLRKR